MPICISCASAVDFLYQSISFYNLRLEQCKNCSAFADPYVEHDSLTLLIDLILLKRGVYRHLLYNRGAEPRRSVSGATVDPAAPQTATEKEKDDMFNSVSLETHIAEETIAFHGGVLFACYLVLGIADRVGSRPTISDIRREFRFSLIPLTLFYSSLTKLFLLFLLTIWRPSSGPSSPRSNPYFFQLFDDVKIDREWIVRNVIGGMSAGFGLRVVLDIHPFFTTIIIIAGWVAKTAVSQLVSHWVGGDEQREAWLAYSIP
ncbi:hypothetical protein MSAN_00415400 [Mycena sanguinolenta]|uniref:Protein ARV n=1 Tax=Mycena sanguinolenta TaxID=230812 RepID=A0A8H6ZEA1_9AGAR|nr:hypothetical protein MSAN_00415400 [Mycena sanguinolenta]